MARSTGTWQIGGIPDEPVLAGKARDRVYAYRKYIAVLSKDTDAIAE